MENPKPKCVRKDCGKDCDVMIKVSIPCVNIDICEYTQEMITGAGLCREHQPEITISNFITLPDFRMLVYSVMTQDDHEPNWGASFITHLPLESEEVQIYFQMIRAKATADLQESSGESKLH